MTRSLIAHALAALLWVVPAAAQDVSIKAFYGTFSGAGMSRTEDSEYFGLTVRDLDVTIQPDAAGFAVVWTTVTRERGTPEAPRIKRNSSALTFAPTDVAEVYRATTAADPLRAPYAWARIEGQTLTVYQLTIDAGGAYTMQVYARTLTGTGMELAFTSIRDGQPNREVKARLARVR